jgi:hypothetical protein
MSSSLGPLEITCDAPPYPVVRASHGLGFVKPEDVRWARMSHFQAERESVWELLNPLAWKNALAGQGRTRKPVTCSCGLDLPTLERYLFTYADGRQEAYMLAQCLRCHTVFWEEA